MKIKPVVTNRIQTRLYIFSFEIDYKIEQQEKLLLAMFVLIKLEYLQSSAQLMK